MSKTARHIVRTMRSRDAHTQAEGSPPKGTDLHLMRESNRLLILNCVREYGSITRADVARHTGLSRTTVSSIMDELLKEGFVREGDTQRAPLSGGRRVIPVHFNAVAGYILGIVLGRNHLTILLGDLAANVLKERTQPFETRRGAEVCLPLLVDELRGFVAEQRIAWSKLVGIGLAVPGPLDIHLQRPASPPLLPGWEGVNFQQVLSKELETPIYVDNNANMGALGESRYGAGREVADLLYLKLGTGIGGGIIMGGQLYRGHSGSAGEIGHMTVDPNGPRCNCGNRGCLEALAGSTAIVEDARQGLSLRRKIERDADGAYRQLDWRPRPDLADIDGVVQAALDGDPACKAALEQAGEHIGTVLASLINFFNPSLIVLDGKTMRAGELLLATTRRTVAERSLPAPLAHTRIVPGALGGKAIPIGGIATVIEAAFGASASFRRP